MRIKDKLFDIWLWATDWYYAWKWRDKVLSPAEMEVVLESELGVGVTVDHELWTIQGLEHLLIRYFPGQCLNVYNRELDVHVTVPPGQFVAWLKGQIQARINQQEKS